MKLEKKNGYEETTVRIVNDDDGTTIGIIGTVKDLTNAGYFAGCSDDCNAWAAIPQEKIDTQAYFATTQDEVIETLIS